MTARLNVPRRVGVLFAAAVAAFAVIALPAPAMSNEFWQAQSIYQVITDRFFDGDPSNNNAEGNFSPRAPTGVHGGDFKGLEQKLDYIKALGATAIWISPVVLNAHGEFHGYAARDFYRVAPHFGTMTDLRHLIGAAHARGLLVIDDIVVNHGGDLIDSADPGYGDFAGPPAGYRLRYRSRRQYAAPFNTNAANPDLTNLFHNYGRIPDFNTAAHVELGELSGLDDFRTESDYVRSNMAAIYSFWIEQAGFDGYRVDTVKHVEMGFWEYWCPAIHAFAATHGKPDFFLFGEVYDASDAKCGSYTGTTGGGAFKLDSVLDYPLYFRINNVLARATGNTRQIEDHYRAVAAKYDAAVQMQLVTFLDNHDQARFLSAANAGNDTNRLNVALVFLYTARGIPCLYYGTEQAFNGGRDPNDREDMFDGEFEQGPSAGDNFNMTHPEFRLVAMLNNFRRLYAPLRTGSHVSLRSNATGPGLLAYARRLGTQEVFVVLNTAASAHTTPALPTILPAGTRMLNLFDTNDALTVTSDRKIRGVTVPPMSAKVFVPAADWRPLDPTVVASAPTHDARRVPVSTPIVLTFSRAMNTNTVQAAFTTVPPITGTFSWSTTDDKASFIPKASLPELTTIIARVADSAKDAAGVRLFASYELRFRTGTGEAPVNAR